MKLDTWFWDKITGHTANAMSSKGQYVVAVDKHRILITAVKLKLFD